jgi:hypothetical protein
MDTGGPFPGEERQSIEADHSLPSSVEIKNGGALTPSRLRLHGMVIN